MKHLFLLIPVLCLFISCKNGDTTHTETTILKHYKQGYIEQKENGLKVLHLKGTAYERGYQRGMLQDDLPFVTKANITQMMVWLDWENPENGLRILQEAKDKMETFVPYRFRQEIQGMADAMASQNIDVTYDDIMLHVVASDLGMMDLNHDLNRTPKRNSFPELTRCSSFSAWGNATSNGKLILCGNEDYYDTEEELKQRMIAIVEPSDGGYAYTGSIWDVFFVASGINSAGIGINGHLVASDSESLVGVSAELLMGMVLQDADCIEDAIEILTVYPRTCGIIIHVTDSKRNKAAVIEYTADNIAVRYSGEKDMLWTTNHFNAYPGWQGYDGINMAAQYNKRAGLENISTVEKWQLSLEKNGIGNAGRYGRYRELLDANYGKIDLDIARSIITDRYSPVQKKIIPPTEITAWNDYPIMINAPDWNMSDSISFYKSKATKPLILKNGNTSSFCATPETGDIWWAIGVPPAGYTMEYTHINLFDEIAKLP